MAISAHWNPTPREPAFPGPAAGSRVRPPDSDYSTCTPHHPPYDFPYVIQTLRGTRAVDRRASIRLPRGAGESRHRHDREDQSRGDEQLQGDGDHELVVGRLRSAAHLV